MAQADFRELGVTGTRTQSVFGPEDLLPELSGRRGLLVYKQMRETDPVIGGVFLALEQVIRSVDWTVVGPNSSDNEFVAQCMEDMSHPWSEFITDVTTCLQYGFSVHEVVYKRRAGRDERSSAHLRSRFSDNRIGWRKIALRHQLTIVEWILDEGGGVQAVVQYNPNIGENIQLPVQKILIFRTRQHDGGPFGFSLLRTAYRPWKFKKFIEEVEGIGIERDLAGLPMIECPQGIDIFAPENRELYEKLVAVLTNVRRDKYEGVIMPAGFKFSLVNSAGSKQFDTNKIINRYDQRIALSVLAQFVLLGVERVGSYALASQQKDLFTVAVEGWLKSFEEVINRFAVARLVLVNGLESYPKIVHKPIVQPTSEELAVILSRLVQTGVVFPDRTLEDWVRGRISAPVRTENDIVNRAVGDQGLDPSLYHEIAEVVGEEKAQEVMERISLLYDIDGKDRKKRIVKELLKALLSDTTS